MTTKTVENRQSIRAEVLYIQPRHDDKKDEEMMIDRMFVETDDLASELHKQRQLNSSARG